MTTLFISDLHLDADRPAAIAQFLAFMEHEANQATALYILGDLFEVWIGDDDTNPGNAAIIFALAKLIVAWAGGYTTDMQLKPVQRSVVNESGNGLSNMRGTVGLARATDPHSGNAQFYINLSDNLDLNPRPTRWGYAVFGTVVEGMEVVDEIGHRPTGARGSFERYVPVDTIVIERVEELAE